MLRVFTEIFELIQDLVSCVRDRALTLVGWKLLVPLIFLQYLEILERPLEGSGVAVDTAHELFYRVIDVL